jgi:RecG-like helicase
LAELDFKLRGVGELTGLAQSGSDHLRFGSLIEDRPLVEFARQLVRRQLRRPPTGNSATDPSNKAR